MIPLSEAVDIFVKMVIKMVVNATFKDVQEILKEGPPVRVKKPEDLEIQKWYLNLQENEKKIVSKIVLGSINRTVFHLLVILDNKTIGYPLEGEVSDFALYLQTYDSKKDLFGYNPKELLRINKSHSGEVELHDIFMNLTSQGDGG
jgi:hypothetical protein